MPVLCVSSGKAVGVGELWSAIEAVPKIDSKYDNGDRTLLRLAQKRMAERFERESNRVQPLLARWQRRELDDNQATEELLRLLGGG